MGSKTDHVDPGCHWRRSDQVLYRDVPLARGMRLRIHSRFNEPLVHVLGLPGTIRCSRFDNENSLGDQSLLTRTLCQIIPSVQVKDYGGWPDLSDMPVTFMTAAHKKVLATKCSQSPHIAMPVFPESPSKDSRTTGLASHTVTPPPGALQMKSSSKNNTNGNTVSPATTVKKPPSKQVLALHRKFQETAEAMGGPGTRIVVSKPAAKKLIFDHLFDSFRPKNITQIYKDLKGVVPSPILKSCLDSMALDKADAGNPFDGSDDEDDKKASSTDSKASSDPFAGSLAFKAGKSANSTLYYVDYNKAKNGNGLDLEERNELLTAVAAAQAKETALKTSINRMTAETKKLLQEPTNEEATARLEAETPALADLQSQVEEARKLQVNEKHKKQVKRRIDNMTAQWRKRRRICMDFLIAMEENTDGTISAKKCLAGDGQIEIDSDEVVAKHALEFAKKKRNKPMIHKKRALGAKKQSAPKGILADEAFVAVKLSSAGTVERVYLDDDRDSGEK